MTALQHKVPIASIHVLVRTADKTSCCNPADQHQFVRLIYEQLVAAPRNNLDILKCLSPVFRDGRVWALHVGENAAAAAVEAIVTRDSETGAMSASGRLCCKSRKLQGYQFSRKIRNWKQSPIRITSIALPRLPMSLTCGDEAPHIFIRNPRQ